MESNKTEIRRYIATKRNQMDLKQKTIYDNIIYNKIINNNQFLKAKNIFIYVSYKNEVDTHKIINYALSNNKNIYVPKVISLKDGMMVCKINSLDDLKPNKMGILEPIDISIKYNKEDFDLVIMPGVAFDKNKNRLGYGGGMYDRFLENSKLYKIAVAYDYQVLEELIVEEHDIKVDEIITN